MEQNNDDKIEKMREEMDNKLEAILKEVKSKQSASTTTNLKSDVKKYKIHNLRDPEQIDLLEFAHLIMKIQTPKTTIIP